MPSDTPERAALRELVEAAREPADEKWVHHFSGQLWDKYPSLVEALARAEAVLNQPEEASR